MSHCQYGTRRSALIVGLLLSLGMCELGKANAEQRVEVRSAANDPLAQPISLTPRPPRDEPAPAAYSPDSRRKTVMTMLGGLAICVGGFLLLVWATRRTVPQASAPLPPEVVEPLGRLTLSGRHSLQLIRLGQKLVLLGVTPQGATSLAEVTDPEEAVRLAGLCQQTKTRSVTASFQEVLSEFSAEPSRVSTLAVRSGPYEEPAERRRA
jgi:flagellar biogenesis protein FliO